MTLILGIETSCDETAAAVVERDHGGRLTLRANVVASQVEMHRKYGGVFPEVAARMHIETIQPVVAEALLKAAVDPSDVAAIAVTHGPGLAGSLLVGVNFAKGLALGWEKPLLGINHLEGHIYSLWLTEHADAIAFPAVCLLVSGGHTELILMRDHGDYQLLGSTIDDAAGEAFDKVARVLGLDYPGGPAIERAAQSGDAMAMQFTRPHLDSKHVYDFSFSGLKTAVMRAVQPQQQGRRVRGSEAMVAGNLREDVHVPNVAASFQSFAVDVLVEKTIKAARDFSAQCILMAGGVSANRLLRAEMAAQAKIPVYYPPIFLCTDNAAMIAAAAQRRFALGERSDLSLDVLPMLPIAR